MSERKTESRTVECRYGAPLLQQLFPTPHNTASQEERWLRTVQSGWLEDRDDVRRRRCARVERADWADRAVSGGAC